MPIKVGDTLVDRSSGYDFPTFAPASHIPMKSTAFGCLVVLTIGFSSIPGSASADVSFRPSGQHGVRITLSDDESKIKLNPALVEQKLPEAAWTTKPGSEIKKSKVGQFQVSVGGSPLTVRVENADGKLVQELQFADDGSISFPLGDAPILGLGEGADQFDRRGANYRNINGQRDRLATLGTRIYSPILLGTNGWALFFASPYLPEPGQRPKAGIDLSGDRGVFNPPPGNTGGVDLFVIDAHQPADALSEIARLTGPAAMPPKWALGYMQSHRTLATEKDMLDEAKLFRDRNLPCDAMIYLGTDFCPRGWNNGHDTFEFNKKVFSRTPAEFLKDMHDMKMHVALHIVPQAALPDGHVLYRTLHGSIPAAEEEDVDATHIAPYWKRHKELFDAGVDGWWPDEGDWLDVPSRIARHRMYYEGPLSDRPNVRPWDLQRNGYIGIGRWGGWVWSGDVQSTWKTLQEHVKIGQNSSLSVSPYWGSDIGGFYPTPAKEYTGELYTRWFQFATFCPSFRSHGRTWHLHTPYGWNTGETGPIESRPPPDESELHNPDVEPICREYLNLRYQLMPYTYTITREAHDTGVPMMRAMWLHYSSDPEAVKRGDQYLWGRDLLIAPVVEKAATSREVYLPAGDWYDWWTGEKSTGGKVVKREVDLKTMPIYVRAGAIIPVDPVRQYIDEPVKEPTTLRIYPGADGNFVLYDDDGNSLDYLKDGGVWTAFKWNDAAKSLNISLDKRTQRPPAEREFNLLLLPSGEHKTVKFSKDPLEVRFGS